MDNENLYNLYGIVQQIIGAENIHVIVEAGANDCRDSLVLAELYPLAHIYSFEPNPNTIEKCREVIKNNDRITLTNAALSDKEGIVKFYPMNKEKTVTTHADGNQGASSLFKASGKYTIETYIQDEIEVECRTLYNFPPIDLMWLDAQGAELMILKGLKEKINNVKIIHLEVNFLEQYSGQPLYEEVKKWLEESGFIFHSFFDKNDWFSDAIFVNKKYADLI